MVQRRNTSKTFLGNEDGDIAILFAMSLVVLVGVVGLSIDGGRAMAAKNKTAAALDAAALAGTRALFTGKTVVEAEAYAIDFYLNNLDGGSVYGADYGTPTVNIDTNSKTLRMAVNTKVPTTFGRVFGVKSIDFNSVSQATFNVRDIELGMQLDITGSMCQPCSKIDDLRTATAALIDVLIPDTKLNKVRIGFAPFASGVNAGAWAATASDGRSTSCVYERSGASADTDDPPAVGAFMKIRSDSPGAQACPPTEKVVPLSDDKDFLKSTVAAYNPDRSTAGHLGSAWAWYLVSPNWAGVWPAASQPVAYHDPKTIKAVILMTDGMYNTFEGVSDRNGPRSVKSKAHARTLCQNMKDAGVLVYTVGFDLQHADPGSDVLLRDCASADASSGNKLFYNAEDGVALNAAFQDIAIKLTNLRLAE